MMDITPFLSYSMLAIALVAAVFLARAMFAKDTSQVKFEDDLLFDPETNSKITLEQAESGNWPVNEDPNRIIPAEEINSFHSESNKLEVRIGNYLKQQKFLKCNFDDELQDAIDSMVILTKYSSWSCDDLFVAADGSCIFELSILAPIGRNSFDGKTVMAMKYLGSDSGHYVFAPKTLADRVYDWVEPKENIEIPGYETHEIVRSRNVLQLIRSLEQFGKMAARFEIEVIADKLFFKFDRDKSLEDVKLADEILKKL